MLKEILFMTGNKHKLKEVSHMFSPIGYSVNSLEFESEEDQIIEPQVDTVVEVSKSKLSQCISILEDRNLIGNKSLMVEDSGLFINSFDGFPGVYSAYVLKTLGCEGILELMKNKNNRLAEYRSSVSFWDGESKKMFHGYGTCPGYIDVERRGRGGFGYDPIFVPLNLDDLGNPLDYGKEGVISTNGQTFGEVSLDCKQQFSHRRRALSDLLTKL